MGCTGSLTLPVIAQKGISVHGAMQSDRTFTDQQKRLVLKNWKVLSNDLIGRGTRIFLRIFLLHPHVKHLFPCGDLEGEDLIKDPMFKGHASRFMQAVGAVMDNIDDYEKSLGPLLNGLGRQHIHFRGFKPDYFNAFEEAIMHIWAEDLGGKFGSEAREAWHRVFRFLMGELKKGFHDAMRDAGLDKPPWAEEDEINGSNRPDVVTQIDDALAEEAQNVHCTDESTSANGHIPQLVI